jgi:hypothetical protein
MSEDDDRVTHSYFTFSLTEADRLVEETGCVPFFINKEGSRVPFTDLNITAKKPREDSIYMDAFPYNQTPQLGKTIRSLTKYRAWLASQRRPRYGCSM